MLRELIHRERALLLLSCFALLLIVIRISILWHDPCPAGLRCRHWRFLFLLWNLYLAWIPLGLIHGLRYWKIPRSLAAPVLILWLLFFPNAPYLITDLIHLSARPPIPLWYDAVLLFTFAGLGLGLGIRALETARSYIVACWSAKWGHLLITTTLLLSGLGIYLGRVERWNSWDALLQPSGPIRDTVLLVINPAQYWQAWLMIALFSGLLAISYGLFRATAEKE